jgi:hypothetical protein
VPEDTAVGQSTDESSFVIARPLIHASTILIMHNAAASEVILGKYIQGSANSYQAVAKARGSTYFSMQDWNVVAGQLDEAGLGRKEILSCLELGLYAQDSLVWLPVLLWYYIRFSLFVDIKFRHETNSTY